MQWVPTFTRSGDTLEILAQAYGVTPQAIIANNNLTWSRSDAVAHIQKMGLYRPGITLQRAQWIARINDINAWILARGGKCLPRTASVPPELIAGCGGDKGWAVFTPETQIMLPNKPRRTLPPRTPSDPEPALKKSDTFSSSPRQLYGLGFLVAAVAWILYDQARK